MPFTLRSYIEPMLAGRLNRFTLYRFGITSIENIEVDLSRWLNSYTQENVYRDENDLPVAVAVAGPPTSVILNNGVELADMAIEANLLRIGAEISRTILRQPDIQGWPAYQGRWIIIWTLDNCADDNGNYTRYRITGQPYEVIGDRTSKMTTQTPPDSKEIPLDLIYLNYHRPTDWSFNGATLTRTEKIEKCAACGKATFWMDVALNVYVCCEKCLDKLWNKDESGVSSLVKDLTRLKGQLNEWTVNYDAPRFGGDLLIPADNNTTADDRMAIYAPQGGFTFRRVGRR